MLSENKVLRKNKCPVKKKFSVKTKCSVPEVNSCDIKNTWNLNLTHSTIYKTRVKSLNNQYIKLKLLQTKEDEKQD